MYYEIVVKFFFIHLELESEVVPNRPMMVRGVHHRQAIIYLASHVSTETSGVYTTYVSTLNDAILHSTTP